MRHDAISWILIVVVMAVSSHTAQAQKLLKLLMPGPVVEGHAKLEDDCSNCHKAFERGMQRTLCLDCHKDVASDVSRGRGYHGRVAQENATECKECHTEHKGRKAAIIRLDPDTFDHGTTDFTLRGAHRRVACENCHAPSKKFREAKTRCFDCHRRDEPHRGRLGKDCRKCHSEAGWRKTRYDHKRHTGFALTGRHKKVACNACHANQRYKNTPRDCYSCHKLNDIHAGRLGRKCARCHSTKEWRGAKFDHGNDTRFPLRGRHSKVDCAGCHTKVLGKRKPARDCFSCHRSDDTHKGRNGRKCADCHSTAGWKQVSFQHDRDTSFPLRGRHRRLECTACHRGSVFRANLGKKCYDCHRTRDVHRGELGTRCQSCHSEGGWGERVRFDHDITRFPLIGQHAVVPCEECHVSQTYKGTETACVECHRDDDSHRKRLGSNCGRCHNPNGWALWQFNHNNETDFALDGAHEGLSCTACHTRAVTSTIRQSKVCGDCHQRDDIHRGGFGRDCRQCHTTKSFGDVRLRR